jgi:hypothetical protein
MINYQSYDRFCQIKFYGAKIRKLMQINKSHVGFIINDINTKTSLLRYEAIANYTGRACQSGIASYLSNDAFFPIQSPSGVLETFNIFLRRRYCYGCGCFGCCCCSGGCFDYCFACHRYCHRGCFDYCLLVAPAVIVIGCFAGCYGWAEINTVKVDVFFQF